MNEAVTVSYDKCLSKKVEVNITQLCEDLLNLLRRAVQENEQVERGGQPYTQEVLLRSAAFSMIDYFITASLKVNGS